MEGRAGHFVVAEEVSTIGRTVGEKDEILGRFSRDWYFALLDTRTN